MRVLLDTHAFLWFYQNSPQLSVDARTLIEDGRNEVLFSLASLWEMAIKCSIGKLDPGEPFDVAIPREITVNTFGLLPIELSHIQRIITLDPHYKDPFDRLLIAQAIVEAIPFISNESLFDQYAGLDRRW